MQGHGLSPQTLVIASLSSAAAAILTSLFWESGTVFSAAFTPLFVALISEGLRKPAAQISKVRVRRQPVAAGAGPSSPAPRPAPLAGSSTSKAPRVRRFTSRRINLRVALVTAGLAFAIAAAILTLPELLTGQSVAGESGRTTLGGGSSDEVQTPDVGEGQGTTTPEEKALPEAAPTETDPGRTAPTETKEKPPATQGEGAPSDAPGARSAPSPEGGAQGGEGGSSSESRTPGTQTGPAPSEPAP